MAHGSHQDGPALFALKSSVGRPTPLSPETMVATERARDRIWERAETPHGSIVGTCLTTADGRSPSAGSPPRGRIAETELQIIQINDTMHKEVDKELAEIYGRGSEQVESASSLERVHIAHPRE